MKRSPFSKPSAPALPADAASPAGNNRLSERPGWDELLRSLSPSSPESFDAGSEAGHARSQLSSPAHSPIAADIKGRDRAQQSREAATAHRRGGQLAILLPQEAQLFAADTPFAKQTKAGEYWMAVIPLVQPSDREHAAVLDCAMCEALASGTDAAARALSYRSEAAQRCTADVQERLAGRMQHVLEDDLCPRLPADVAHPAYAIGPLPSSTLSHSRFGSTTFCNASASLALAIFMADLVAQVEGHCAERGRALARLWNAHITIAAQTAGAQREALQQLQIAHAAQEAQLLAARAEAAAVQRLRKQLANQSQVADVLRAEVRDVSQECNALRQQLVQAQSDAASAHAPTAPAPQPVGTPLSAADVQLVQG